MIYQLNLTMMMWRSVSDFRHNLLLSLIVSSLSFLSFKLYFINGREFCLLSLKHNAQLRYFETRPSCHFCFITSCSLLSPAQILEETHPSVHGSPFLAHDPDTVGTFSVPPDPAGKVSTFLLFDWLFWRVRSTNTTFYTSPLRSKVISFMIDELIKSRNVTCGILISTHLSQQQV